MATYLGWRDQGSVLLSKADAERQRADEIRGDLGRDAPVFQGAVMSRREHRVSRVDKELEREREEASAFVLDRDEVFDKRAESRLRWLQKALFLAGKKSIQVSAIYDIITHKRFVNSIQDRTGGQMKAVLLANLHLFSAKQQKFLQSEACALHGFDLAGPKDKGAKVQQASKERDPSPHASNQPSGNKKSGGSERDSKKKKRKKHRVTSSSSSSSSSRSSSVRRSRSRKRSRSRSRSRSRRSRHSDQSDEARAEQPSPPPQRAPQAPKRDPRIYSRGAADDLVDHE